MIFKIYFSIFFLTASLISSAQENWKLEKNKDGIKVWTRKPENSNLKEFKATTTIATTVDKLVVFFKNYKLFEKWMYKIEPGSVKLIKKTNDNDYYLQLIMSAPLIKSRESLMRVQVNAPDENGTVFINLDATPTLLPSNDNYVRIQKMKAYWKFTPLANGKVEVTHQALSSVGGNIPETFVNLAIADAPFSMLTKLKEMVK